MSEKVSLMTLIKVSEKLPLERLYIIYKRLTKHSKRLPDPSQKLEKERLHTVSLLNYQIEKELLNLRSSTVFLRI